MLTDVYATCPPGFNEPDDVFGAHILRTAKWSEQAGLRGLLVFTDNNSLDPWAIAQFLVERTERLVPLVAVQPAYMHPYTTARMVSSISALHSRQVDLNLVAGGYPPDLRGVGCFLDHDARYARLVQFSRIVQGLFRGTPVSHDDTYYQMAKAVLHPSLPVGLEPKVFVSGSSPAAINAVRDLGVLRLTYPLSPREYASLPNALAGAGIRVGIIARESREKAWRIAHARFPLLIDRVREAAASEIESHWHGKLWSASNHPSPLDDTYWLRPFRTSGEFCPYLVGSYEEVAEALAYYINLGASTLILSVPWEEDDIYHSMIAVRRTERVSQNW